ncbi:MAG: carbon-nitrogen family hydrolase [Actinocrinis sp.]
MKVALIQFDVDLGRTPGASRQSAVAKVHEAAEDGADLVLLPELWLHGAFDPEPWQAGAEPMHGETAQAMREAAIDCGVVLHAGSFVERTPDGRLYNTSLVFDADGELLAGYRKIHTFGFDKGEAVIMTAGEQTAVFDLRDLDDSVITRIGLATCYDLRFPELYRKLLDAGTQTVLQVASWPARRAEHWRALLRARAIENQMFVVACASVGTQAGLTMSGHSMVIDPWGEILAEGGEQEETVFADFDPETVEKTRASFPVLRDRRL